MRWICIVFQKDFQNILSKNVSYYIYTTLHTHTHNDPLYTKQHKMKPIYLCMYI